jgi:membrane fusion protein (multidrug efflux system)
VIIADKGKAKFVTVITGAREASTVEVVDGLKPGDTLITTGILFVKPESVLKFLKVKNKTI